jgi:hypothetical protein
LFPFEWEFIDFTGSADYTKRWGEQDMVYAHSPIEVIRDLLISSVVIEV